LTRYLFHLASFILFVGMIPAQAQIDFTGIITDDYIFNVPSDFSDINAALNYLSDKSIKADAFVTIQVADGTYTYASEILVEHPQGDRIKILGNTTTPANCVLECSDRGFRIAPSSKLGLLDGFTLDGNDTSDYGLYVQRSGFITCGLNMIVHDFNYGVFATKGAIVHAKYIEVYGCGTDGVSSDAATVDINHGNIHGNDNTGVVASTSGTISFHYGISEYNGKYGVNANSQSNVNCRYATISNNTNTVQIYASYMSLVYAAAVTGLSGANTSATNQSLIFY